MIAIFKKTGFIVVVSFLFILAGYTASIGLWFSLDGMWQDEPRLMTGYAGVFAVSALMIFIIIKKDWINK